MSQPLIEEQALGKVYDARLMRRLLGYAKPFWRLIVAAIVMVLFVTAADLSRPYLMKVAIDSHISVLHNPMAAYPAGKAPQKGVAFDGKVFVREPSMARMPKGMIPWRIVTVGQKNYLVQGLSTLPAHPALSGGALVAGGHRYAAVPLTPKDLSHFRSGDVSSLITLGLLYLLALVVSFGCNYAQIYILEWCGQNIIFNMRQQVMKHLEYMPMRFFDQNPIGRLVTRATNDIEALNEMYTSVLVNVVKDLIMVIGIVIVMLSLDLRLALISFAVLPVLFAATIYYRRLARSAYRQIRIALARINAFLSENLTGIRVVQSFQRQARQRAKFETVNQSYLQASLREVRQFAVFRPFMDFLYIGTVALLVWFGGGNVLQGVLTFGVVYAFINYVQLFFQPINDITQKYAVLQSAMAASERIFLLLDTPATIVDQKGAKPLSAARGEVAFDHVWFAYDEDRWVLSDIDFTIGAGERVAFVGATGAGKTSIMHLMGRFYEPQKGAITLDGEDISTLRQEDLRRHIAIVQQDVFLFSGTVAGNIRLNNTSIDDAKVRAAAEAVGADSFIRALPRGYDEPVHERGVTLSTGQRQLLSFARALAADPAILVLDEATANVDTETELLIQKALKTLVRGRTTIMVAHRLSTIQHADKIVVLHKGRIREIGDHQSLLRQGGYYYDLYRLQYKEDYRLA